MSDIRDQAIDRQKRSMNKKGHKKFSALNWKYFPENVSSLENLVRESFFHLHPKLGARSPPVHLITIYKC